VGKGLKQQFHELMITHLPCLRGEGVWVHAGLPSLPPSFIFNQHKVRNMNSPK
jgi:hypothetical protein